MKNKIFKRFNKGFTLIELLAVMAVVALIIVLVVPNVINSMNKNRKNAMLIYANRVVNLAKDNIEEAKVMNKLTSDKVTFVLYDIDQSDGDIFGKLNDEKSRYRGCVKVLGALTLKPKYKVYLVDIENDLRIDGVEFIDLNSIDIIKIETSDYEFDKDVCK